MILTEAEAATKRCQESFGDGSVTPVGHTIAVQYPHGPMGPGFGGAFAMQTSPSFCIGAACMAWRIAEKAVGPDFPARGYCGKAGKP